MSAKDRSPAPLCAHETPVRVRYGEVDRMGFLYHGHYLVYFEMGRTEMLRSLGVTYRDLEDQGTLLVVVETGQRHLIPAGYDDHLVVRTTLAQVRGVRLRFEYELRRDEDLLATGHTVLASCDTSGRPRRMPTDLRTLLDGYGSSAPARKEGDVGGVQGAVS
ncbi:MAG: thioesterase family protein [Planctomycetota bacterium]|nr:thioesterase family protein [Planctomycetota bacterium]